MPSFWTGLEPKYPWLLDWYSLGFFMTLQWPVSPLFYAPQRDLETFYSSYEISKYIKFGFRMYLILSLSSLLLLDLAK